MVLFVLRLRWKLEVVMEPLSRADNRLQLADKIAFCFPAIR